MAFGIKRSEGISKSFYSVALVCSQAGALAILLVVIHDHGKAAWVIPRELAVGDIEFPSDQ